MHIKQINIENYKCFRGMFSIALNHGLNVIVGDNEAGKSTILEAIHLALTGVLNGRYLRNELSQYFFNNQITKEYIASLSSGDALAPPYVRIEVFFESNDLPLFEGDGNSTRKKECGVIFTIEFDPDYQSAYEALVESGELVTIPIEYYRTSWKSCARERVTSRSIPIKSALIDSSSSRYRNGSDIYISRIIRDDLEEKEKVAIAQAYRKMKEAFRSDTSVRAINDKIQEKSDISNKTLEISVDLSTQHSWETTLMTFLDETPFHQIGKGEQCIVKTNLALGHKKSEEANLILLEEPENHLTHTSLNQLIRSIKDRCQDKQVVISTHSSFVANKLGLEHLILLNNQSCCQLSSLTADTQLFFKKLSGYDTLRLLLCSKAILVEGDSDELVVQKAFMDNNNGQLPIENRIDVISVGTAFLRFLEIANAIGRPVSVVTDNDGDVVALEKKYAEYLGKNKKFGIDICYDTTVDSGPLKIAGDRFNYNTLEPKLVKENGLKKLNAVLGTEHADVNALHSHMKSNKTQCALKIFDTSEEVKFPQYILEAIKKK